MKKHLPPLIALATLLAALPLPAAAQEEPAAEFEGLVEVSEVLLDVVVTDKKGKIVRGLGPDDFVVTEDGEEVEITSAGFYTTRYEDALAEASVEAGETAGEAAPEVPSSRYFILFFEDQRRNSTPANRLLRQQLEAGRKAHDWVRDHMGPSDWVAVVSYDVKLIVHQDFTQDVGSLVQGIHEASRGARPENLKRSEYGRATSDPAVPSLWRGLPDPVDMRKETKRIYDAVRLIAEASRPIAGRKNLLYFGIGFGELETPGYARGDTRYYPAMEEALNDNNMAVYPVDLTPHDIEHSQSHFMNQLAMDTGGYYHENILNFEVPLRQISEENLGYYVLSYRAEHPSGESGYRDVTVKPVNKKLRVRARRGYRYGV